MHSVHVERFDHLGRSASLITEGGRISRIDARLVPAAPEAIPPGAAVAGMILNGLGCAKKPVPRMPQFFATKPLALLCRAGGHAAMCKRFTRGRTRDEVSAYGCALLVSALALAGCAQARLAPRFAPRDTPCFSLPGASAPSATSTPFASPTASPTTIGPTCRRPC